MCENSLVVSIGEVAFKECKDLLSVKIPATFVKIKDDAFFDWVRLKEVVFEEGSQLATIGEDAFYGCACSNSIEFPNGLKG